MENLFLIATTLITAAALLGHGEPLQCLQLASPVLAPQGLMDGADTVGESPVGGEQPANLCQRTLMQHSFGNSYGNPFVASYKPPDCDFNRAVLNLTVVSEGHQFDRLAVMFLNDTEVWRTSTAEPESHPGIAWTMWKDVTPLVSLWRQQQTIIFDLGNIVNDVYTGSFNATLTVTFFEASLDEPQGPPADLVVPVSARRGSTLGEPSSFTFPDQEAANTLTLPRNIRRAVFSVAANGQIDEEFWWLNVPQSLVDIFNEHGDHSQTTPQTLAQDEVTLPGLSAFREIRVRIDGTIVGLAWPFPVVFTGGISPPLHRPIVGIEAFDLGEYEVDITPWLGLICNGEPHTFSIEVVGVDDTGEVKFATVPKYWVLTGKIFLWLDENDDSITTGSAQAPIISDINFHVDKTVDPGDSANYTQTIERAFHVEGSVHTANSSGNVVWSQRMSMNNTGWVSNKGAYQDVDASYLGSSKAIRNDREYFSTAFDYPIIMRYRAKAPDGDYTTTVATDFEQGLSRVVTGWTSFTTGVEPFLRTFPGSHVAGTALDTYRAGSAFFYQKDGRSGGNGTVNQSYRLDAVLDAYPGSAWRGTSLDGEGLLYSRFLSETNETITADRRYVKGYKATPNLAQQAAAKEHWWREAEYAPVQLRAAPVGSVYEKTKRSLSTGV